MTVKTLRKLIAAFAAFSATVIGVQNFALAENSGTSAAVVFVYHRIGQADHAHSNTTTETFIKHLDILKNEGFTVLPLSDVLSAFDRGQALPDKSVAITLEGAFKETFDIAIPALNKRDIPYTIFFASDRVDRNSDAYMTWDNLRALARSDNATFGIIPADHVSLLSGEIDERRTAINRAMSRVEEQLGTRPAFFSYPYGEYSEATTELVSNYDFKGAFGQHSGVASAQSDRMTLPRFSITERYASDDRFRMTARALPLNIVNTLPEDTFLPLGADLEFSFTLPEGYKTDAKNVNCFASEVGKLDLAALEDDRFQARIGADDLPIGRIRINCTLPSAIMTPGEEPRWHWHGLMVTHAEAQEVY